jgi:hypothetical protein
MSSIKSCVPSPLPSPLRWILRDAPQNSGGKLIRALIEMPLDFPFDSAKDPGILFQPLFPPVDKPPWRRETRLVSRRGNQSPAPFSGDKFP